MRISVERAENIINTVIKQQFSGKFDRDAFRKELEIRVK